jgi:heat shock protein HslJ
MRSRSLALAALPLLLLAACARPADTASPAGSGSSGAPGDSPASSDMVTPVGGDLRIGEAWYLVTASVSSARMPDVITLSFEPDRVGGQAPVNTWSAEYTATDSGGLELGPIASTLMAGSEEAMDAEGAYFALLETVDGYTTVEGGELYLFDGQMNVLVYSSTPQPEVEPTISDAILEVAGDIVGMTEAEAQAEVGDAGFMWRVVARDGEQFALTEDYVVSRINATIVDDRVTETYIG